MDENNRTIIFTDGSSRGNPGPGGWAAVIVRDGMSPVVTEIGGRETHTTNNRMEIMAAMEGLSCAGGDTPITLFTDSSYLINGITKWIYGWKKNGWLTKTKDEVLNKDLWMGLSEALLGKKIDWKHVGGHVGIAGNERCDEIATAYADGKPVDLYEGPLSGYGVKKILDISRDSDRSVAKINTGARSKSKAYSYVSAVGGVVQVHHTWEDCERRVKGTRGARFKKALSVEEEGRIKREFGR